MSEDDDVQTKSALREHAEIILKMTNDAKRVQRRIKAEAVIIIGVFKDGNQLRVQDAGTFIMPPVQFYDIMQQAHINGQMGHCAPKLKPTSKIIKPH